MLFLVLPLLNILLLLVVQAEAHGRAAAVEVLEVCVQVLSLWLLVLLIHSQSVAEVAVVLAEVLLQRLLLAIVAVAMAVEIMALRVEAVLVVEEVALAKVERAEQQVKETVVVVLQV